MKKASGNNVIPTKGLLSDMESLEIYGGKGIGTASPDGNGNCAVYCECINPDPKPKSVADCNDNCGGHCKCV